MTALTPEVIAEIEGLMRACTPGEWAADPRRLIIQTPSGDREGPVMSYLAGNPATGPGMTLSVASERHADHHLIAATHNALPALLAAARLFLELEAVAAKAKTARNQLTDNAALSSAREGGK